ncbi:urate hydroxylase PuuD [Castellaniella defragrans]|uniref:urate hydroxylase PuuD n=1 Tax=Castellaniella defragrans TaxID=75697 RepID=UPI002AFFFDB8|nr:urate hydroxylase PuuD [Castellaniella defragrans]
MQETIDWLSILVRWGHVIAAITWVGTSFYFNWFDLLVRPAQDVVIKENNRGVIHEMHGGSFYYHEQYWPDRDHPRTLAHSGPAQLTFLSGLALMALLYWAGASVYLIDGSVLDMPPMAAVSLSVFLLAIVWPVYYAMVLNIRSERVFSVCFAALVLLLCLLCVHLFSARGAFIQVGAMLGTVMALSVHFVIVPNHIRMRRQVQQGQPLDIALGERAKRVSAHNNYITLPVVFAMLSTHFSAVTGSRFNWLVLFLLMLAGVLLRHWRNVQFKMERSDRRLLLAAASLVVVGIALTRIPPSRDGIADAPVASSGQIHEIVRNRCVTCHSATPNSPLFASAPLGFKLDTLAQIEASASLILARAVNSREMPPGNLTHMTDEERAQLGAWLQSHH